MMTEEVINQLIDSLSFVKNPETRKIILNGFIEKYGEIPEEYKDAIDVMMEI